MDDHHVARYAALFRGNLRSHGVWDPKTEKMWTENIPATIDGYRKHLTGELGLGQVPILDDGTCYFGAIDIDNHDPVTKKKTPLSEEELLALAAKVASKRYPLVVTRSKSKCAHIYVFGREALKASTVQPMLKRWAEELGVKVDCLFPKQVKLPYGDDGARALGNWINLPYFNGDDTERYAVDEQGHHMSLDLFLHHAESIAITQSELDRLQFNEHADAPPCIQAVMAEGCPAGTRNDFMFNVALYLKKRDPGNFKELVYDINPRILDTPLPMDEIKKIVGSVGKQSYRYRCQTEPCKSHCNSNVCVTRRFGIEQRQLDEDGAARNLPPIDDLVKVNHSPVTYRVTINGKSFFAEDEDLLAPTWMQVKVLTVCGIAFKAPKRDVWYEYLAPHILNARVEDMPVESSAAGSVLSLLELFFEKTLQRYDEHQDDRRSKLQGVCAIADFINGKHVILFRLSAFKQFCAQNKHNLSGIARTDGQLFALLSAEGITHTRVRMTKDSNPVSVWVKAYDPKYEANHDYEKLPSDQSDY